MILSRVNEFSISSTAYSDQARLVEAAGASGVILLSGERMGEFSALCVIIY